MKNALAGIAAVLDAAAFTTDDRKKLMALQGGASAITLTSWDLISKR